MRVSSALIASLAALGTASAFVPAAPRSLGRTRGVARMSIAERELEAGATAPFGEGFDPLNLSAGKSFKDLKKFREAELKHGRVAMLAVLGVAVQENFHPLFGFNEKEMDGAIFHFQEIQNVYPLFWTALIFLIGLVESKGIAELWDKGYGGEATGIAGIREEVITGNLGLDPFGVVASDDEEKFIDLRNKELNNGRLAMIAAAGIVVQEKFVTGGLPEFELHKFALSDVPTTLFNLFN